jgi:hypothetical protein
MPDARLEDDGGLSSDFTYIDSVPDGMDILPGAVWIGVRRGFGPDGRQVAEPAVWLSFQDRYMDSELTHGLAISPEMWRELNRAVEWRLQYHEEGKSTNA